MKVVILGAGFAGLTLAAELEPLAAAGKADVVLVERNAAFQMGFSIQWVLAGRRTPAVGQREYASVRTKHVRFLQDEVAAIDVKGKVVHTRSQRLSYDRLVIALGAELAPDLVPGLADAAYNLCDMGSIVQFREALRGIDRGSVLIAVSSVPFKCPPAPYEYALLVDDILRKRGVRESVRVVVSTPEPHPMPVAGKAVGEQFVALLKERGIEFLPGHKPKAVDVARRTVAYENGVELTFGLFAAMPPHRAPKVVRDAGLADASGFVPVDLGAFRTAHDGVLVVGDTASLKLPNGNPHPKAGVFAEAQARAVASALRAEIAGGTAVPYDGKGVCFVDAGNELAAAAEADLLGPGGPRIVLRPPSSEGLEGKRRFERERFAKWFGG